MAQGSITKREGKRGVTWYGKYAFLIRPRDGGFTGGSARRRGRSVKRNSDPRSPLPSGARPRWMSG